jgi:hypothetical protein
MKLFKADLKATTFWETLPQKFKELSEDKTFYVFFYNYSDSKSEIVDIDVNSEKIVPKVSVKTYKGIKAGHKMGYFQYPMDSQNTLFYQFIKFYCRNSIEESDLKEYFKELKFKDLESINDRYEKTINNNVFKIFSRDNFVSAIDRFLYVSNEVKTNTLSIFDSIDAYVKNKENKSLYGGFLVKIVKAIRNPNGGLVPDTNTKLRYMLVGENSELLKDENSEYYQSLEQAKDMYRNNFNSSEIYIKTKWYYNSYDKKWRMPILDKDFKIKDLSVNSIYISENSTFINERENIKNSVFQENSGAIIGYINQGYDVYLGDVVKHPTLFKHYPELYKLPIFYALNDTKKYSFYYSPKPKHLMIFGNPNEIEIKEVFIHEIQHAIQRIENFGTGGSYFTAKLITSIGGENIKSFLFKKQFVYKMFASYVEKDYLAFYYEMSRTRTLEHTEFVGLNITTAYDIKENVKNIFDILFHLFIFENKDGLISAIMPFDVQVHLKEIKDIYRSSSLAISKLSSQGYSDAEISRIVHSVYENLSGEIESRYVQQISNIDDDLLEYFTPLTSESINKDDVSVMFGDIITEENISTQSKGAIELNRVGQYTIHLFESNSPQIIIHEIGHFVYDIIENSHFAEGYIESKIVSSISGVNIQENPNIIGEIFVDLFLSYLVSLNLSEDFNYELSNNLKYNQYEIFKIEFDEIFMPQEDDVLNENMTNYLNYLKELNNLI